MYDVMGGFNDFINNQLKQNFDWVTALPMYQHLYNTTVHSALGTNSVIITISLIL